MSRSIDIGYRYPCANSSAAIELRAPYFLLGTQSSSMRFWSLPQLKEIGIVRLAELGISDPVHFCGWEDMDVLAREIALLQVNLATIDFDVDLKSQWLSHLVYCHSLLIQTAPKDSIPEFEIG